MPLATGRRGVVLLGTAAQRAECYQERPHDPSGVAAFMSAHSKTPCVTHGINVSSGKGVVRGRRLQQLAFTLHRDDAAVGTAATAACRYLVIRPCAGRRWRAKGNPVQHRMSGGTSTGSLREKNTATTNRLTNPDYLDKYPLSTQERFCFRFRLLTRTHAPCGVRATLQTRERNQEVCARQRLLAWCRACRLRCCRSVTGREDAGAHLRGRHDDEPSTTDKVVAQGKAQRTRQHL